jgi:pimeloyl-ACP methyl ester carboxylesterase
MRLAEVVWLCSVPAALGAQQVQSGAYVARRGDLEITRERYRFDGRRLDADVEVVGRGLLLETETEYDAAGASTGYRLRVRTALGAPVLQELSATVADSVSWTLTVSGRSQSGAVAVRRPAVVVQNLVFSQLAAALRGYDRARGGRQVLDAWLPEGGSVLPLALELSGDSGTVEVSGVTMRLTLDGSGWVERFEVPSQGLTISRQQTVAFSAPPAGRGAGAGAGADTLPPRTIHEDPYLIDGASVRLVGTLALPAAPGPVPVVVMVAGSGAVDRNGNAPPALRSNLYAQLAWRLAEQGVASLRYDKRGVGESAAGTDPARTTLDDVAEDLLAATRSLAGDERFGPIVIVGHSEGGWLAIRAALRGAPVTGIALLATPGRPFLTLLREQLAQQLDSATLVQYDSAMARYLRGDLPVGLPPYLQPLFRPVNQRYTASLVAYDALAELRRVDAPVLVVQGDRDVQVMPRDAEGLVAAKPGSRLVLLPGANHLFKLVDRADRVAQLGVYADPTAPVMPELVEALLDWMRGLRH